MTLSILHIGEPQLEFRYGQKVEYPRDGLFLYGPVQTPDQVHAVRYGAVGTRNGIRRLKTWATRIADRIATPESEIIYRGVGAQHVPWPGFEEAFHASWPLVPIAEIDDLDPEEISRTLRISNRHEAVRKTVDLFVDRLVAEKRRLENPPAFWFVVIPEIVYQLGRPQSRVATADRVSGAVAIGLQRARRLQREPTLFGLEDQEAETYKYAAHFRRQLKARLLTHDIVTQVVRETTLTPDEFVLATGRPARRVEDPATVAWKLGTGVFYKAGGRPWQLADVRPGVCYVGLVYKRTDATTEERHACCAAQMFLTNGDGVVFRGALGPWYQTDRREFHLDREAARNLLEMVIAEYRRSQGTDPAELFLHAQAGFGSNEWAGFSDVCPSGTNLVGVQVSGHRKAIKLFRMGQYPVIRGTALKVSDSDAYLWTSGYVPRLATYMGPETPNPIYVRVQRGSCRLEVVLNDLMGLTKVNFNSCLYNDRLPVTIRFANQIGDVLVAAPSTADVRLPFKFYI